MKSLFRVYCAENRDGNECSIDFLTQGEDYEVFEVIRHNEDIRFRLVDDNLNLVKFGFPKRFFRTYEDDVKRLEEELSNPNMKEENGKIEFEMTNDDLLDEEYSYTEVYEVLKLLKNDRVLIPTDGVMFNDKTFTSIEYGTDKKYDDPIIIKFNDGSSKTIEYFTLILRTFPFSFSEPKSRLVVLEF